jgi:hypothetical protein
MLSAAWRSEVTCRRPESWELGTGFAPYADFKPVILCLSRRPFHICKEFKYWRLQPGALLRFVDLRNWGHEECREKNDNHMQKWKPWYNAVANMSHLMSINMVKFGPVILKLEKTARGRILYNVSKLDCLGFLHFIYLFIFVVLEFELRVSHFLGRYSTTWITPWACFSSFYRSKIC